MKTVNKTFRAVLLIVLCVLLLSTVCLADNEYAEKGATWILDGLFWIVIVAGLWYGGLSVVKRNITGGIVALVGASVVAVICKNPSILENLGTALKNILGL